VLTLLAIFAAVFVTNLLPAFAPPTWALLVFFKLQTTVNPLGLVIIGVLGAVLGRYFLARASSKLGPRLRESTRENLRAAAQLLESRRSVNYLTLILFALSPVSSAQLFEAAGLTGINLQPLLMAFVIGRSISYSGYVYGATALKHTSLAKILAAGFTSPWAIAIQVLLLLAFIPLTRINWKRFLGTK